MDLETQATMEILILLYLVVAVVLAQPQQHLVLVLMDITNLSHHIFKMAAVVLVKHTQFLVLL